MIATVLSQLNGLEPLPERQRLVAVVLAVSLLATVLELLRRRKLREEYSWLWVITSLLLIMLAFNQDLLRQMSGLIGAVNPASTLFFGALLFLLLLVLQFSIRLSRLTLRHRTLAQRLALLEEEVQQLRARAPATTHGDGDRSHPDRPRSGSDRDAVA